MSVGACATPLASRVTFRHDRQEGKLTGREDLSMAMDAARPPAVIYASPVYAEDAVSGGCASHQPYLIRLHHEFTSFPPAAAFNSLTERQRQALSFSSVCLISTAGQILSLV